MAILVAATAAWAAGLPGFRIELFDGKTGTVSIASRDFAAPIVTREGERIRLTWEGHPLLGDGFTATAEGVKIGDATRWTFSCAGNSSGLPLGRIAFPVVDVPCADKGYLLHSPHAGGGTMGWKMLIDWKSLKPGQLAVQMKRLLPQLRERGGVTRDAGMNALRLTAPDGAMCLLPRMP